MVDKKTHTGRRNFLLQAGLAGVASLRSPQDFISGNVMPFSGVPDSAERAGLIAYLRSLK